MLRIGWAFILGSGMLSLSGSPQPLQLHLQPVIGPTDYICPNYFDADTNRQTLSEAWCQKRV